MNDVPPLDPLPTDAPAPVAPAPFAGAPFPVVGIGASAGGLEALQKLFGALPVDTGMSFVVVQHLSPDHASSLAEILSRATQIPVSEVGDEPAVAPNHIHVIPPGRDMIVAGGKLVLLPQQRHIAHRGIDRFLRSLADDSGHLAIGVVLSGGQSDGTVGLEEIKAAGGVTFAQDDSARHDSMPKSAIASGCVDFVLPPEGIAAELVRIARHAYIAARPQAEEDRITDHSAIAEIVRGATGVDFRHYKSSTLRRRITRRMMLQRHETQADYEAYLRETPGEIEELFQDILISVTSFFRDPDAFEALARNVFPKLIAAAAPGEAVRLWVAGCSSGEEAYSLAMVFTECVEAAGSMARLQVFATDVNPRCVEKARAGWYPRSIAPEVSPERLRRFFTEEGGGYRVRKSIRERCVFSRHNLLGDPPFSRVDFISCRNVLIYLEAALQQKVIPILHYALKPDGWLWLGSSESVGTTRTLFEAVDLRNKIFSRRPGDRPASTRVRTAAHGLLAPDAAVPRPSIPGALHRDAERLLLAKYAPPGVVVSAGLEIVQFQGDTSPYLAPASGTASHNLLKMLREGLTGGVRDAVQRAQQENAPVRVEGLSVRDNGSFRTLAVEVIPIKPGVAAKDGGFVVLFDEAVKPAPAEAPRPGWLARWAARLSRGANAAATARLHEEIRHLRQELAATRESLLAVGEQHEAVVEELRSANEEAQSANEEMQSVNEELETSKEEMEAANEELGQLNDELNSRNAELNRVNDELRVARDYAERILSNVPRPLLVLDGSLRVRSASRAFYDSFRVAPADTEGRFFYDLGNRQWDNPELRYLLEKILPQEVEVRNFQVRHDFPGIGVRVMELNARRLTHVLGAESLMILSIEDVTERETAVQALRRSEAQYRAIGESIDYGVWICDAEGRNLYASESFLKMVGLTQEQCSSFGWGEVLHPEDAERTIAAWKECVRTAGNWDIEHRFRGVDGEWHPVLARGVPVKNERGEVVSWAGINLDIRRLKQAEAAVRESEERFRGLANAMSQLAWTARPDGHIHWYNQRWYDYTGTTPEAMEGWGWQSVHDPVELPKVLLRWKAALASGEPFDMTFPLRGADGVFRPFLTRSIPLKNAAGEVLQWFGTNTDVTMLRDTEVALQQAKQAAESANASKDRFLAVLSHELRTPLTPVLMTVGMLEQDATLSPELREEMAMIKRNIELETKIIDDLLDVSRIVSGKIVLHRVAVDLNDAVRQACAVCETQSREHNVPVVLALADGAVAVRADPARLQQVLWNVVKNAIKFSKAPGTVQVSTARIAPNRAEVRVRDQGIGIPAEAMPRIFEAFEQGDPLITQRFGGLGLGLAISKALIELHGGSIRAESAGHTLGATFVIELPVDQQPLAPASPPPAPAPEPKPALRLLVVEDDKNTARTIRQLLASQGYGVTLAHTVAAALEVAKREPFDVLVTDLGLADGTGYEVLAGVKKAQAIPAVAMSGYGMEEDLRRSRDAGFVEHLVKPFELPRLLAAIQRAIAAAPK